MIICISCILLRGINMIMLSHGLLFIALAFLIADNVFLRKKLKSIPRIEFQSRDLVKERGKPPCYTVAAVGKEEDGDGDEVWLNPFPYVRECDAIIAKKKNLILLERRDTEYEEEKRRKNGI
jgi:hypothetical protein